MRENTPKLLQDQCKLLQREILKVKIVKELVDQKRNSPKKSHDVGTLL